MKKFENTTLVLLPRENRVRTPIYEHCGKFYIKANKPNTGSYIPFRFNNELYSGVHKIKNTWFIN